MPKILSPTENVRLLYVKPKIHFILFFKYFMSQSNRYGGMKISQTSKENRRAQKFFDSAEWAMSKNGEKTGPPTTIIECKIPRDPEESPLVEEKNERSVNCSDLEINLRAKSKRKNLKLFDSAEWILKKENEDSVDKTTDESLHKKENQLKAPTKSYLHSKLVEEPSSSFLDPEEEKANE